MNKYVIQCKQTGDIIDEFPTLDDAKQGLEYYETSDIIDGIFTTDFYEIAEVTDNGIIPQ